MPKDRYYFYKSQWDQDTTTLHILPAWHSDVVNKNSEGKVRVNVFSNARSVEFTVTATSEGLEQASITVNTKSVSENDEDRPVAYTTPQLYYVKAGTVPNLAEQVTVHYENKEDELVNVSWETFDTSVEGVYTVNGALEGLGVSVKTTVVVIDEVGALLNYSTSQPKGSGEVELTASRPIVTKDGKVLDASYPVEWEEQDTEKYKELGTYIVNGTANIFEQKVNVTASIRIADAVTEESDKNIAPNYLTLTQDIPQDLQSDSLLAIVDGDRTFKTVQSGPNTSVWTNYDAAQANRNKATLTFTFATAQVLYKADLYYYRDTWSASLPEGVVIEYSADGGNMRQQFISSR